MNFVQLKEHVINLEHVSHVEIFDNASGFYVEVHLGDNPTTIQFHEEDARALYNAMAIHDISPTAKEK